MKDKTVRLSKWTPITYNPTPNSIFDSAQSLPDKVTIVFTERPEIKASSIKVLNSNNERIDTNDLTMLDADKTIAISLDKSKITPGIYTVNWAVLSKDDGHITKGSYVFTFEDKSITQNQNQQSNLDMNRSTIFTENYTSSDNIVLNFSITSFTIDQNNFTLVVNHENGTALKNIMNIFLKFNNPEKNLGPLLKPWKK